MPEDGFLIRLAIWLGLVVVGTLNILIVIGTPGWPNTDYVAIASAAVALVTAARL